MSVRVEFEDDDGRTRLTLHHTGIPNEMTFGVITGGRTSSLGQLGDHLAELTDRDAVHGGAA